MLGDWAPRALLGTFRGCILCVLAREDTQMAPCTTCQQIAFVFPASRRENRPWLLNQPSVLCITESNPAETEAGGGVPHPIPEERQENRGEGQVKAETDTRGMQLGRMVPGRPACGWQDSSWVKDSHRSPWEDQGLANIHPLFLDLAPLLPLSGFCPGGGLHGHPAPTRSPHPASRQVPGTAQAVCPSFLIPPPPVWPA